MSQFTDEFWRQSPSLAAAHPIDDRDRAVIARWPQERSWDILADVTITAAAPEGRMRVVATPRPMPAEYFPRRRSKTRDTDPLTDLPWVDRWNHATAER